jgi:predicted dehydrogenase
MPEKLRVVQIGCGDRAPSPIAAMHESGAIELVAVCDRHEEKRRKIGAAFKVPRLYHNLKEMIQIEKPDLVNIVTRPEIRLPLIEQAIEAGAPALLIEKPMALTPAESMRLVELGRDRLIAVNTQYQWMPHWQRFWKLLADGELGKIRLLRASTRTIMLDQGPHILDLALKAARVSGLPDPEWVLAACAGKDHIGAIAVPADVTATVGLGEARLHLNAGPSAPVVPGEDVYWYQQQIEVTGDKGRLWVSLNQGWKLWRDGKFETGPTKWPQNDGEAQEALFLDLRDTLRSDGKSWKEFPTRVEIAARNSDVIFGCYVSALRQERFIPGNDWLAENIGLLDKFFQSE